MKENKKCSVFGTISFNNHTYNTRDIVYKNKLYTIAELSLQDAIMNKSHDDYSCILAKYEDDKILFYLNYIELMDWGDDRLVDYLIKEGVLE